MKQEMKTLTQLRTESRVKAALHNWKQKYNSKRVKKLKKRHPGHTAEELMK